MNYRIFAFLCIAIIKASQLAITNTKSPIVIDLPFDQQGKGRIKAYLKNFNPEITAKHVLHHGSTAALKSLFIVPLFIYIPVAPVFLCSLRTMFPALCAKSQIPNSQQEAEWKTVGKKKAKEAFEYQHRGISSINTFSGPPIQLNDNTWEDFAHKRLFYDTNGKYLAFKFNFRDQQPKKFQKLSLKVPFEWSGYLLKWYISYKKDEVMHLPVAEEINLLQINPEARYFHILVTFKRIESIQRPKSIDLLTLEYQMVSPFEAPFTQEYDLKLKDGRIKLTNGFLKEYAPAVEMLLSHRPQSEKESYHFDLSDTDLSASSLEILQLLTKNSFSDLNEFLNQYTVQELTSLLFNMDYLLMPNNELMDLVTNALLKKVTLENGCEVIKMFPKEGNLGVIRKKVETRLKNILMSEAESKDFLEVLCKLKVNE